MLRLNQAGAYFQFLFVHRAFSLELEIKLTEDCREKAALLRIVSPRPFFFFCHPTTYNPKISHPSFLKFHRDCIKSNGLSASINPFELWALCIHTCTLQAL